MKKNELVTSNANFQKPKNLAELPFLYTKILVNFHSTKNEYEENDDFRKQQPFHTPLTF